MSHDLWTKQQARHRYRWQHRSIWKVLWDMLRGRR